MTFTVKACGLFLLLLIPTTIFAWQDEDNTTKEGVLQTSIMVTAEKKENELKDVPLGISVLSSEAIEASGLQSIKEMWYYVPNMYVGGFSAKRTAYPFIRGIGSGQGEPGVSVYIDGVPQLSPSSNNIDFLDMERIEILRGPQGTLYGRNTIGGLIHYITRKPSDDFSFNGEVELANHDQQRYAVSLSGAISPGKVYYRVGAAVTSRDGFVENQLTQDSVDDQDGTFFRGQLLFTPNDQWEIRISAHTQEDEDGGFTLSDLDGYKANPYVLANDYIGFTNRDLTATSITAVHSGEYFDVTAIAAFDSWEADEASDLDFLPLDFLRRNTFEEQDQTYGELRFNSNGDNSLQWTLGLSYWESDFTHASTNELRPLITQQPFSLQTGAAYNLDNSGWGIFGQLDWSVTESLVLVAGGRFVNEDKDTALTLTSQLSPPPLDNFSGSFSDDFDKFIPKFGFNYHFNDDVMGFVNFAESYRSGGFNYNTIAFSPVFDPNFYSYEEETSTAIEAGVKASLRDDRVYLAITVFDVDWEDRQLSIPIPGIPGQFYLDNAADATSQGIEIELAAQVSNHFDILAGLGTTNAEFGSYLDPTSGVDVDGNELPLTPDMNGYLIANYHTRIADAYKLHLRGEYTSQGSYSFDNANSLGQSAFDLVNLRIGMERGGFGVELWGKNLTEEEWFNQAIPATVPLPGLSGWAAKMGEPRTYGVTLRYRH